MRGSLRPFLLRRETPDGQTDPRPPDGRTDAPQHRRARWAALFYFFFFPQFCHFFASFFTSPPPPPALLFSCPRSSLGRAGR